MTSLAWFLTRDPASKKDDEALVKKAFHDLRREYASEYATSVGVNYPVETENPILRHADLSAANAVPPPADPADVVDFLRHCQSIVRHDDRIKDRLRPQWQAKLDAAIADVENGNVPDLATFGAWVNLEEEARRRKEEKAAAQMARVVRVTDEQAAREALAVAWGRLKNQIEEHGWGGLTATESGAASAHEALDQLRYADEVARQCRGVATLDAHLADARSKVADARREIQATHGDEAARQGLRVANARMAELIALHPQSNDVRDALARANQSTDPWASLAGSEIATRAEKIAALECIAGAQDRHLVRIGALQAGRIRPRARRRAQLRAKVDASSPGRGTA